MRVAIVIHPTEFRDESLSYASMMLGKWGIDSVITSYSSKECVGYHGAAVRPHMNTGRVNSADFDAILLLDGPGVDLSRLYDFRPLLDTVAFFNLNKKPVAAIGNAVKILAKANIISGTKISLSKDRDSSNMVRLFRGIQSENPVELDHNILTAGRSEDITEFIESLLSLLGAK